MKENPTSQDREYIAFISYRHCPLDMKAARLIQKKIESFTVPAEFRDRVGGRRLGMVFRDEDELPASSSLSNSITYALDHSRYLLVICTPDLPKSIWCEGDRLFYPYSRPGPCAGDPGGRRSAGILFPAAAAHL